MKVTNRFDGSVRIFVSGSLRPAIVDKDDCDLVMGFAYHIDSGGYATRNTSVIKGENRGKSIRMASDILGIAPNVNKPIIYLNNDLLDCRKRNLAAVSPQIKGGTNRLSKNNTSGFKGVSWSKVCSKWIAYISPNKKRVFIGVYQNAIDAAKAYDAAALKYFGSTATTNKSMGLY